MNSWGGNRGIPDRGILQSALWDERLRGRESSHPHCSSGIYGLLKASHIQRYLALRNKGRCWTERDWPVGRARSVIEKDPSSSSCSRGVPSHKIVWPELLFKHPAI